MLTAVEVIVIDIHWTEYQGHNFDSRRGLHEIILYWDVNRKGESRKDIQNKNFGNINVEENRNREQNYNQEVVENEWTNNMVAFKIAENKSVGNKVANLK